MEEHQPLPHRSWRTTRKPPLPLKSTPIQAKRSHLTKSSTSRAPSSSSELPKSYTSVSIETLVTPTISGTFVPEEEVSQLPEDISTNPSVTVTEVFQQQVDIQLETVQPESDSELETAQLGIGPESIPVLTEVTCEPGFVQEPPFETVVHLPEHLDFEFQHSEFVTPETSIMLALCFWYGSMIHVLYLMATHTGGNALIRLSKCWKLRGTQENSSKGAYPQVHREGTVAAHTGHPFRRCVPPVHLLQGREACSRGVSYVWPVVFSPPFLILWFWPVV